MSRLVHSVTPASLRADPAAANATSRAGGLGFESRIWNVGATGLGAEGAGVQHIEREQLLDLVGVLGQLPKKASRKEHPTNPA